MISIVFTTLLLSSTLPILAQRPPPPSSTTTTSIEDSTPTATPRPTGPPPNQRVLCEGLSLADGTRVRREWRDLSPEQQENYLEAVRTLVARGEYRDIIPFHEAQVAEPFAHYTNAFLHWHREFVLLFEDQLRGLGDRFSCITLPYWDWTADVGMRPEAIPMFRDMGGVGDHCVVDEIFGPATIRYGGNQCVTRPFPDPWRPSGPIEVTNGIVNLDRFTPFSDAVKGWHALPHNQPGGTMRDVLSSPNDPAFWSHHAFVDKLFATWQYCHNASTVSPDERQAPPSWVYEESGVNMPHGFDDPMLSYPYTVTPRNVHSIERLNYTYAAGLLDSQGVWRDALSACPSQVPWMAENAQDRTNPTAGWGPADYLRAWVETVGNSTAGRSMIPSFRASPDFQRITDLSSMLGAVYSDVATKYGKEDKRLALKVAAQEECKRLGPYKGLPAMQRAMLGLPRDFKMPCEE